MGSGTFNTKTYRANATAYKAKNAQTLFQHRRLFDDFDPLKIKSRESCASEEHPDPTSIIIACDVTGSMGKIPENLLKAGLGKIMESLQAMKSISNPQVMFAAVGDTEYDQAPLQVTQFESDNRIESQLKNLYLEGGGGGNLAESYNAIWYFAARKTQLDCWKQGKKGLLFTMGDELMPDVLKGDHIRKFIDPTYKGLDISTTQLCQELSEKYEIFHLVIQDTSTYERYIGPDKVNACWREYLGERAILVSDHMQVPDKIVATVDALCALRTSTTAAKQKAATLAQPKGDGPTQAQLASQLGLLKQEKDAESAHKVLSKDSDNVPHLFTCPISYEIMKDPVMAEDGYTYERTAITQWLHKKAMATSPMTNKAMGKVLTSNHALRSEIEQWRSTQEDKTTETLSTTQRGSG